MNQSGKDATYVESGGIALGKNAKLVAGPDFTNSKGAVTYTVTNNSGVSETGVAALVDKITTVSKETADNFAGILKQQNEKVATLAEVKQTTDEDRKNKSVLYIALAALAVVALWAYNRL